VVDIAHSGVVRAVHCEKPMALTWGDAKRMVEECEAEGVALTINHQQRFGKPYRKAKDLLDDGKIGDLRRIEFREEHLYDTGTHSFDLANFYNDMEPVEWVLAQIDYTDENVLFGTHNENQAIAQWRYENGVYGLAVTGDGSDVVDAYLALSGTDGRIELGASDGPALRYRSAETDGWEEVDVGENVWGDHLPSTVQAGLDLAAERAPFVPDNLFATDYPSHIDRAIAEVVRSYRTGTESTLDASVALRGTELVFAAYESVRRRGRVDLPLSVDDNPLESMVDEGLVAVGSD
jgi:predicted dehydrogenase